MSHTYPSVHEAVGHCDLDSVVLVIPEHQISSLFAPDGHCEELASLVHVHPETVVEVCVVAGATQKNTNSTTYKRLI